MESRVVDVNSAQYKEDERRLQSLRSRIVLWLIVLALGVLLVPLMLIAGWVRNDRTRLETELLFVQNAISDATSPSAEVLHLNAELAQVGQLVTSMQTVTIPTGANWPLVVDAVAQYDQINLTLTALTQTESGVEIRGRATTNDAVVRYQQRLLDSAAFKDVVVNSMTTAPPANQEPGDPEAEAATAAAPAELPFGTVEFVIDLVLGTSTP